MLHLSDCRDAGSLIDVSAGPKYATNKSCICMCTEAEGAPLRRSDVASRVHADLPALDLVLAPQAPRPLVKQVLQRLALRVVAGLELPNLDFVPDDRNVPTGGGHLCWHDDRPMATGGVILSWHAHAAGVRGACAQGRERSSRNLSESKPWERARCSAEDSMQKQIWSVTRITSAGR
jgi:hypothetical protein